MNRPNLRLLGLLAWILLISRVAWATPPNSNTGTSNSGESVTGSPSTDADPKINEFQSLGVDRRVTAFSGTVLDMNDHPVPDVQVKLFMDGQLVAGVSTGGDGHYDLQAPYDPATDVTVLLWFVAADRSLMAKELVLRESRASKEHSIISSCVPRATVTPGRQFRVYLFDPQSRNKELSELNCLP